VGFEPTRRLTASSGFQDRLDSETLCAFEDSGGRVRAIWGIKPALSSLRPLAHFEPYRCESALRGASRLGGGAPWRKQICHRLATWQATAAEDLTGRWLLPERGLFRSLRKS
jgi:hypothetical protein